MCGEHSTFFRWTTRMGGSSPHVRGAQMRPAGVCRTSGIIPACAGSTIWQNGLCLQKWDHPRMCGEHIHVIETPAEQTGSSPHVRGAPPPAMSSRVIAGIIPACAGSTSSTLMSMAIMRDHPRMCGEHYADLFDDDLDEGSSPHVRGAQIRSLNL